MSDQAEVEYLDGDIVWVKLGSCWWPGEVVGPDRLPPDVMPSFKKPPIAVVRFFQESTYEYVKNSNSIYKYNCSRKNEFINKGLYMYRTKHGHMEKFPEDVIRAETAVGGDKEILTRDEFQEVKKESYAGIFGDAKKTPGSGKKGRGGRGKSVESTKSTPTRRSYREKTDYKVHILVQTPKERIKSTGESDTSPSTSRAGSEPSEDKAQTAEPTTPKLSTPSVSSSGIYACHSCNFSTARLNVLILHNKTHSSTFVPYTPSPVRKKSPVKPAKSTPKPASTPKTSRPRKEKVEKPKKEKQSKKRAAEEKHEVEVKKPKTDQEIKSSLLADWDDVDEELSDEPAAVISESPEEAVAAESPALPVQPDIASAQIPLESSSSSPEKKPDECTTDKPESSSDSKYEFCEDEDWPVEAGVGRIIPRVKNISKGEKKSISIDDEEIAKEVAELLTKTAVPELPSVPEPLKAEENFPEPPVIKSPDKVVEDKKSPDKATENKSTKAIFKTKTFFRSRHSRSQDAIGKYVAEQLNAAERMDISEGDLNGSEVTSSPEARDSPPVDNVKVARLAPKIQLKKMKAEAEMKEKEKSGINQQIECTLVATSENVVTGHIEIENSSNKNLQDVLYPTQEIKPINKDLPDKIINNDNNLNSAKSESSSLTSPIARAKSIEQSPKKFKAPETFIKSNDVRSLEISSSIEELNYQEVPNEVGLPETSQYVEELHRKTQNQQNEITSSSPSKPIEQSQEISSSKKTEASPIKKYEQFKEISSSSLKFTDSSVQGSFENMIQPYMNESTASAVDALLSVSREADRVPKVVTNDLPEDLFEDDNKDNGPSDNMNGICIDTHYQQEVTHANENNHAEDATNINHNIASTSDIAKLSEEIQNEEVIEAKDIGSEMSIDSVPSESDLQIAEALINLPSSAVQTKANDVEDSDMLQMNVDTEPFTEEIVSTPTEEVVLEETQVEIPESFNNAPAPQTSNNDGINIRFETEQEKSENLNAAQSLVQMSCMDHALNVPETTEVNNMTILNTGVFQTKQNNGIDVTSDKIVPKISNEKISPVKSKFEANSKLLKMLEEPSVKPPIKNTPLKLISGKEKILNFDVAKSTTKQTIFIRRPNQKTIINNLSEVIGSPDKIILSRNKSPQDGSSVQTYTIKTSPDVQTSTDVNPKQIIIQPKIRKVTKTVTKLQKIKPHNSLIQMTEQKNLNESQILQSSSSLDDPMFDINSMPVVLSDEILTPESIEKMPIVMSDGNIITTTAPTNIPPPKLIKTKPTIIENEKVAISALPIKPEVKKIIVTTANESNKVTTPNILSKSAKLRGKPMLVFDKITGKQKIIMTKAEPVVKEVKPAQTLLQPVTQTPTKSDSKFLILPSNNSPRPATGRTQKIVIDPQTGKAHVLITKGQEPQISAADNKPVSAKLIPSSADPGSAPGNTVMIITNAQGTQSRIVLTPEHEKILFPNKQPNVTQLKTLTQRISTASPVQKTIISAATPQKTLVTAAAPQKTLVTAGAPQKTLVTAATPQKTFLTSATPQKTLVTAATPQKTLVTAATPQRTLVPAASPQKTIVTAAKTQTRIISKQQQKSAIITSKGQLIVGGRVTTTSTAQIAPKPEIRHAPKRIMASEPKKLVQAIQKTSSEPLIFLQQKSGAVMQLTAAQFEHLQKTGQIVQKPAPALEKKITIQKSITLSPKDTLPKPVKQRVRKMVSSTPSQSSTPSKKAKRHDISLVSAPALQSCLPPPPLAALSTSALPTVTISSIIPTVSNTISVSTSSDYPELENFEELLPSTQIAKQPEPSPSSPRIINHPPEQIEKPIQPEVIEQVASQEIIEASEPFAEPAPGQLSDGQLLAVPGESFGGPAGSFYLCVDDNGVLTPIDNRPLVLENNQLVPMAETMPMFTQQPERRDILEAALANSDVFHAETPRDEAPDFRDLNANVSVHCRVSETSTVLNQPIMTPVEVPSKIDNEATVPSNLEDGLAVIGVTPHTVPTSLELPITVTDPRIAPKTTDPLCNTSTYTTTFMPSSLDMSFESTEEVVTCGSISMPLLTDEECVGGKSMPILTEEVAVSSVESLDSPLSLEARDDQEDAAWSRRLLTPNSDTSETSSEIPLQPHIQLSVNDISRHN